MRHALSMFETKSELAVARRAVRRVVPLAGAHLVGIISPERRLSAADLARYLVGVRHLVVATVTEQR